MTNNPSNFIFTITTGHSGTTWLTEFFRENLSDASVYHEILGYDRFGVDTPDVSHMTRFNSAGNCAHVRDFWARKTARILAHSASWYVETSHLLAKCGLVENLGALTRHGKVFIICLDRDLSAVVASMRKRGDMLNKGDQWLWHLDPDYPRKLVDTAFFRPYGVDGWRLWYACEMRCRAAYYRRKYAGLDNLTFLRFKIEELADISGAATLLKALDTASAGALPAMPSRQNQSAAPSGQAESKFTIDAIARDMAFDPEQIAANFLARGGDLAKVFPEDA